MQFHALPCTVDCHLAGTKLVVSMSLTLRCRKASRITTHDDSMKHAQRPAGLFAQVGNEALTIVDGEAQCRNLLRFRVGRSMPGGSPRLAARGRSTAGECQSSPTTMNFPLHRGQRKATRYSSVENARFAVLFWRLTYSHPLSGSRRLSVAARRPGTRSSRSGGSVPPVRSSGRVDHCITFDGATASSWSR